MPKELEALERLSHHIDICSDYYVNREDIEDSNLVKSALEQKEKLEKAWEIVKNKNILIRDIKQRENYADYIMFYHISKEDLLNCEALTSILLTETEFNLLKEML